MKRKNEVKSNCLDFIKSTRFNDIIERVII